MRTGTFRFSVVHGRDLRSLAGTRVCFPCRGLYTTVATLQQSHQVGHTSLYLCPVQSSNWPLLWAWSRAIQISNYDGRIKAPLLALYLHLAFWNAGACGNLVQGSLVMRLRSEGSSHLKVSLLNAPCPWLCSNWAPACVVSSVNP